MSKKSDIPRFIINLEDNPKERWKEVIEVYKEKIPKVISWMDEFLKGMVGEYMVGITKNLANNIIEKAINMNCMCYSDDIRAISELSGIKMGLIGLMQITYELFACCTTLIAENKEGKPIMIRTMDWEMDILKEMTIELDFRNSNGKTLFLATSWAGYVGILTGMKPKKYAVAINFRRTTGSMWENFQRIINSSWPVGFLVRHVLENMSSYDDALSYFKSALLIAPTYISIIGSKKGQSSIITRERDHVDNIIHLDSSNHSNPSPYLVQTNCDSFINSPYNYDILYSKKRLLQVENFFINSPSFDLNNLLLLFSSPPILNHSTIYLTYMVPRKKHFISLTHLK